MRESAQQYVLQSSDFQKLLDALIKRGYQILGPTIRDGAIVYEELISVDDLPVGWTDEQNGGIYRLKRRDDQAMFGYAVGPHSWKKFLHPPVVRLWQATQDENGLQIKEEPRQARKMALIAARSCELHAIAVQDRVFMGGNYTDPGYKSKREQIFTVAINCSDAGGTCFCVSMKTGPKASFGFDLALTEVLQGEVHYFVAEVGSELGGEVLRELPVVLAQEPAQTAAENVVEKTRQEMGRTMDTTNIKDLLYGSYEHPRWENVAARCLTCANCTMVCPTCFCTTVEDVTDLQGEHAERWQKWDSCFTMDFSYIHGGSVRATAKARYRQWMTHKLATWFDQFGSSGCVGCGRCITWCPVGIDITEEVAAIRETKKEENNGESTKNTR
ncbi:MAG TPA: 4Fe-4S dicluster domain-containing protein [Terriglobales bacterium]|jgi:ferredoxin|nr:4Fe-4S dicluster domain-containing protein [Terriglobales bacterium]